MKKKAKTKKPSGMPEFAFKQFTPDEDMIYEGAVSAYRKAIEAGRTLKEAYESYSIGDKELESLIQADFLKIMIAEMHFGKGQTVEEVAKALSVSASLIADTRIRMLQEAGVTAAKDFSSQSGPLDALGTKTND